MAQASDLGETNGILNLTQNTTNYCKKDFPDLEFWYEKIIPQCKNANLGKSNSNLYWDCFLIWLREWRKIFLEFLGLLEFVLHSINRFLGLKENGCLVLDGGWKRGAVWPRTGSYSPIQLGQSSTSCLS